MLTFSQAKRVWRGLRNPFFLNQPLGIVEFEELPHGSADVVDSLVDAAVDDLFLEGSEEAFGHAVGFGLADEGEARRHAPEFDLVLEVVGHECVAMVVTECKTACDPGRNSVELGFDRHADSLGRGVAITNLGNMPPHSSGRRRQTARLCHPARSGFALRRCPTSGSARREAKGLSRRPFLPESYQAHHAVFLTARCPGDRREAHKTLL